MSLSSFFFFFLAVICPGKCHLRTMLCSHPASHSHMRDAGCNYSPFLCSPSTAVGALFTRLDVAKRPRDLSQWSSSQKNVSTAFCSPVSHENTGHVRTTASFNFFLFRGKISWAEHSYSSATNYKQCQSMNFFQANMANECANICAERGSRSVHSRVPWAAWDETRRWPLQAPRMRWSTDPIIFLIHPS